MVLLLFPNPISMFAPPSKNDLRLCGAWTDHEPGWTDRRIVVWLRVFLSLGLAQRLLRFGLNYPLWNDEAFLAANLLDRDFSGLTKPLEYQQVCPLFFLWLEEAICVVLGFNEWTLRIIPTLASIASLFLFRHLAGRLLKGIGLVIAVAILAIGYTPIRHGGEVKPYATDFLLTLALITLAVDWLRRPDRIEYLWGLVPLGPLAVGLSNPAIFIEATVGLVLIIPVLKTRSPRAIVPLALFGIAGVATFLVLLRWVNGPQSASVMQWMRVYWARAFPPRSLALLVGWLARVHTSQMFAYPAGGDIGGSSLTTGMVVIAIVAYVRRGSKTVLFLLLTPFALGLIAAFLGRYPYGGSARTMQYVAPAIIVMAGLGTAVVLARLPRRTWRERSPRMVLFGLLAIGLGMMAWDVAHPYKILLDLESRDFARRFWAEESSAAELVCARTDLHLPLDSLYWQGDRAATYLCHQAMFSDRHRARVPARLDRVSVTHPLRLLVFGETPRDFAKVSGWIEANAETYELRARREHVLNKGHRRGKASSEDRYVVYELVPNKLAASYVGDARR
jgi:hypothetical protein